MMFMNTGKMSLYLGIGVVLLGFLGVVGTYIMIRKNSIDPARLDKLIDVGKWFIASVAIVVAATVVSDSFKERETEIKELDFFDKYTVTVTKTGGTAEKRLLAEYFATVSPPGEFQDAWIAYEGIAVKADDKAIQDLAERTALEKVKNPTDEQKQRRVELSQQIEVQQKPLVSAPDSNTPEEWFVVAGTDESLPDAQPELAQLRASNGDARIYEIRTKYVTLIPHLPSRDEATKRLTAVQKIRPDAFVLKSSCTSLRDMVDYVLCSQ